VPACHGRCDRIARAAHRIERSDCNLSTNCDGRSLVFASNALRAEEAGLFELYQLRRPLE
jgi:hypothetical protein